MTLHYYYNIYYIYLLSTVRNNGNVDGVALASSVASASKTTTAANGFRSILLLQLQPLFLLKRTCDGTTSPTTKSSARWT